MSGHRPWSEIRSGPAGAWRRAAGDDRELHHFTQDGSPGWWQVARCGVGPAVGKSDSDARLGICTPCLESNAETRR